ncbi:UDP-N-acetylmuramoyl-L-alanyl-D-glutamate--2,6-diaminopimelate ligase [Namhaeicola litoreus]|uniref:UDP-N-acetylmuramoyl-L-alanyl-D-glutamate--2,6-diaminopimelate ligase n=1 Tax=Namhaeicola litoreus TaxID=1052145 RepID=A0ABW3XXY4_9FLAO
MKSLKDILSQVEIKSIKGSAEIDIIQVSFDSRDIVKGALYVAQKGLLFDGHTFIDEVISKGAVAIVCQEFPKEILDHITYVLVQNSQRALAIIASNFYGNPSRKLKLVGVTGTNGKTTVATQLYNLFQLDGKKSGLISTISIKIGKEVFGTTHTTPDSITINKSLAKMVEEDVEYCFMEVSSHGIHQSRTAGLVFEGGIFTNLTHDHLDYHKTFSEYRDVKKRFFDELPKEAFALTNADDKNGMVMLQNTNANQYTYALKTVADFKGKILENQFSGLVLSIDGQELYTKLIGEFNAYNLLAIYGAAILLGIEKIEVLRLISMLKNVDGRFQYTISPKGVIAIVDYAHTPDALKNVLETINSIRTNNENVITVVGCGGDRDKEKRPKMASIATQLSNQVILTSDNPRTEDPVEILKDMEQGVAPEHYKKYVTITDRFQAIKTACQMAEENDIILIAGKGHETYQILGKTKIDFDDFKIAKELLNQS